LSCCVLFDFVIAQPGPNPSVVIPALLESLAKRIGIVTAIGYDALQL
jgi:hypothetical protein